MQRAKNTRSNRLPRLLMYAVALMLVMGSLTGCGSNEPATDAAVTTEQGTSSEAPAEATDTAEAGQVGAELNADEDSVSTGPHAARWGEITDKVAAKALLLCVDTKADYDSEHVTGATSVPAAKIDETSGGWKKDATIVLTSSAEEVARSVASHLARAGFTDVYYLGGGYAEWDGTFEGTDAREATVPSRLYYLYTSAEDAPVIKGSLTSKQIREYSAGVADSMKELGTEFDGDVDVEIVDVAKDSGRGVDLVKTYDVEITVFEGAEYVLVPRWILVDRDGKVTHVTAFPMNTATSSVYGWCVEQAETE